MNKIQEFYNREPINTSRQKDIDLLKSLSILFMVVCHCVMFLNVEETSGGYIFASYFLGVILGAAPAFMLSMGLGIIFTKKNNPKSLFIRGLILFGLAYVFNFFRIGIMYLIFEPESFIEGIIADDILQFAGLSFMLIALFKKLKLKSYIVLIIAIALSATSFLFYDLPTGNAIADTFIGILAPTTYDYSGFPLTSWFIFVVFGMFLANTIQRVKNLDKFYLIMMPISFAIAAIGDIYSFLFVDNVYVFYGMNILTAIGLIATSLFLLSVYHFVVKILPEKVNNFSKQVSSNITSMYCIHWCFVGPATILIPEEGLPMWVCYVGGIVLFIVTYFISVLYHYIKRIVQDRIKNRVALKGQ